MIIKDKVIVDGDTSLVAIVIGLMVFYNRIDCKISWVHNGEIKEAWVDDWRLTKAEEGQFKMVPIK